MAELTISQIGQQISDEQFVKTNAFSILKALSYALADNTRGEEARNLLIRLLEHRSLLNGHNLIMDKLLREIGLFPYIDDVESLGVKDQIAFEFNRPLGLDAEDIVFHRSQAEVYRSLLDGESIILSAPTSFGKSLIIDAIIAAGKFSNIAVVVPTISLIDETRRRLSKFSKTYKLITHPSQPKGAEVSQSRGQNAPIGVCRGATFLTTRTQRDSVTAAFGSRLSIFRAVRNH